MCWEYVIFKRWILLFILSKLLLYFTFSHHCKYVNMEFKYSVLFFLLWMKQIDECINKKIDYVNVLPSRKKCEKSVQGRNIFKKNVLLKFGSTSILHLPMYACMDVWIHGYSILSNSSLRGSTGLGSFQRTVALLSKFTVTPSYLELHLLLACKTLRSQLVWKHLNVFKIN